MLRKPLQDYLDALVGLPFNVDEKKSLVSRLNFMTRSVGVRAKFGVAAGPLAVTVSSLRIQASSRLADGREKRTYTGLGTLFPALQLAEAQAPSPRIQRKVPKPSRPSKDSRRFKYLRQPITP